VITMDRIVSGKDTSRTGASFVSKRAVMNAREIIVSLVDRNSSASRDELFEFFQEELRNRPGFQRSVDWYFFINMYSYATGVRSGDVATKKRHDSDKNSDQQGNVVRGVVENIKGQVMLLTLSMPNGKPMRDCTGQEMASFGAAYKRVADKVGKTKTVGEVLDEDAVRALVFQA
jgi:Cu/Ag efflux pump CusA